MTKVFRPSVEQCRLVNVRLGGDGRVRDELTIGAALGAAYVMAWNKGEQRWELELPDPVDRAVLVLEGLIRDRSFERANTATAMAIAAMILMDAGLELTLQADRAAAWAETAAEMRSTRWLRTWLQPWIQPIEPRQSDE